MPKSEVRQEADAMTEPTKKKRPVPWKGRKRVTDGTVKNRRIEIRISAADHAAIEEMATAAGLTVGGYLRAAALGGMGPRARRKPTIERKEMGRILGLLGNVASNVNQIARWCNTEQSAPSLDRLEDMLIDFQSLRAAIMGAFGYDR
jgi:predicted DNA binding CopG/RHH family protein